MSLFAPEPAPAQPPPGGGKLFGRRFHGARERWRQMSPEDRQRFRMNAERWLNMSPEERRVLRDRESARHLRLQHEADAALQQSGLQLEAEKREAYERRYIQERRRIERAIRLELEEKRQRELAPVQEQLKKEFGNGQNSAPINSPLISSPSPNK
ncbi:MAG: DUF3106 domain-containing protein [Verrucomicrobiota bacterium]|nr:DUF3106 domain-containing protein [Verrucomicrobiota bacterium]MDQ6939680.1 DUF3106 domain-containing protein [Verrucomicrobiota bacterium]